MFSKRTAWAGIGGCALVVEYDFFFRLSCGVDYEKKLKIAIRRAARTGRDWNDAPVHKIDFRFRRRRNGDRTKDACLNPRTCPNNPGFLSGPSIHCVGAQPLGRRTWTGERHARRRPCGNQRKHTRTRGDSTSVVSQQNYMAPIRSNATAAVTALMQFYRSPVPSSREPIALVHTRQR